MSRPRFRPIVYDLDKKNHFVTKVSTNTTDEKPNVVFLRAKIRITPLIKKKTYEDDILAIKKDFEEFARNLLDLDKNYDNNYIFSIDIAEKSVRFNKTSHLHYDLFVKALKSETLLRHKKRLNVLSNKMDRKLISLFKKYNLIWK